MKAIWLETALDDLDAAISWVATYDGKAALQLDNEIAELVNRLEQFPLSGRSGRVDGTREAIIGNYILVYTVCEDRVEILRVIHAARKYPSG